MKTFYTRLLGLTLVLTLFSCSDKIKEEYYVYSPVYLSYEDFPQTVKSGGAREISNPGKIYFKGDTLFVVEQREGIHAIDVSDLASPRKIGFIEVPGCLDIAIRNRILFTENYTDLVALDISDLNRVKEIAREEKIYPFYYDFPETDGKYPIHNVDYNKGVVIGWEVIKIERDTDDPYPYRDKDYIMDSGPQSEANLSGNGSNSGASTGQAGSMACFGQYGRYLYTLYYGMLSVYDIADGTQIAKIRDTYTQSNPETMFIYDDHMFLGTTTGVDVFDLKVPSNPEKKTVYSHITSCDPVVIQNGYAYYTLRGGTSCNSNVNRLDILKLSDDYMSNELLATYTMREPYGLGIDGNTLFVCDGPAGLKVFDVTDKQDLSANLLATFDINAYDVIPYRGYLFTISNDGFFIYDYSNIENVREISRIPVVKGE